jgi:hypothetical protein
MEKNNLAEEKESGIKLIKRKRNREAIEKRNETSLEKQPTEDRLMANEGKFIKIN